MNLRRTLLVSVVMLAAAAATRLHAQSAAPMPVYSAAQVMQSLYGAHLPSQAQAFLVQSEVLLTQTRRYCNAQANTHDVHKQWLGTLLAWERLSTPALGPLLTRRSQRSIDFLPTRLPMLMRAVASQPQTLADLDRIGTPAKGLPAMEHLLSQALTDSAAHTPQSLSQQPQCRFLSLLTQDIVREARALQNELHAAPLTDWITQPEATRVAMTEWLNQWLAAVEKLRWAEIEKPVRAAQTSDHRFTVNTPQFSRQSPSHLDAWRAQWESLSAQARLTDMSHTEPPVAGQSLIPIDALLMSKGHLGLAKRWTQALDQVGSELASLTAQSSSRELLSVAQSLKKVTLLFQTEVASALDIPLGFSDADGD